MSGYLSGAGCPHLGSRETTVGCYSKRDKTSFNSVNESCNVTCYKSSPNFTMRLSLVVVPGCKEVVVSCLVDRLQSGKQYLLYLKCPEDSPVAPPNCCIQEKAGHKLCVWVANVATTQKILNSGEQIPELESNFTVLYTLCNLDSGVSRLGMTVKQTQSKLQIQEMEKINKEFEQVFYKGGKFLMVQVGIEYPIQPRSQAALTAS